MDRGILGKVILFTFLIFLVFFSAGFLILNERDDIGDRKLEMFINSITQKAVGKKFVNFEHLHKNHDFLSIEFETSGKTSSVCYRILQDKLEKTSECEKDIEIIMDEHATSSILTAPYNPIGILISEFLMGHIKVGGISIDAAMSLVI